MGINPEPMRAPEQIMQAVTNELNPLPRTGAAIGPIGNNRTLIDDSEPWGQEITPATGRRTSEHPAYRITRHYPIHRSTTAYTDLRNPPSPPNARTTLIRYIDQDGTYGCNRHGRRAEPRTRTGRRQRRPVTVGEAIEEFLTSPRRNESPNTRDRRRGHRAVEHGGADHGPVRKVATKTRDICPETGRMRLGYDRARTLIKHHTGLELHQLRHSAATHLGEKGADATVIMAKTHHKSIRTLARYTKPGLAAVTELLDPPRRRA